MKKLLPIIAILFAISTSAQIPGKKVPGPIQINDTLTVAEGDELTLGAGTANRGEFKYFYQPANGFAGTPEVGYGRNFAGRQVTIKFFKKHETKKAGTITQCVVNVGGLNGVIDIDAAIEAGEVVAINGKRVGPAPLATTVVNQQLSPAEELAKWKKLLDDGVITQEEFDAKKKKILEGN